MDKAIPSIGVVVIDGDKVLLVRHKEAAQHITGTWGLPSGKVEDGETAKNAAIRELKEETGLDAKRIFPLPTEYTANLEGKAGPRHFHWQVFHCVIWRGELKGDNKTDPEWVTFKKLEELQKEGKLLKNVINAVEEAKSYLESG